MEIYVYGTIFQICETGVSFVKTLFTFQVEDTPLTPQEESIERVKPRFPPHIRNSVLSLQVSDDYEEFQTCFSKCISPSQVPTSVNSSQVCYKKCC